MLGHCLTHSPLLHSLNSLLHVYMYYFITYIFRFSYLLKLVLFYMLEDFLIAYLIGEDFIIHLYKILN